MTHRRRQPRGQVALRGGRRDVAGRHGFALLVTDALANRERITVGIGCLGWLARLLPYLEQSVVFSTINYSIIRGDPGNNTAMATSG